MPGFGAPQSVTLSVTGFADKIAELIIDPVRNQSVLTVLKTVKTDYTEGVWAWISWFFGRRTRTQDLTAAVDRLDAVSDIHQVRFQVFLDLFSKGEWETTSVNTTTVVALAALIPGYLPLKAEDVAVRRNDFRTALLNRLEASIRELEMLKLRAEELKQSLQIIRPTVDKTTVQQELQQIFKPKEEKLRFCDTEVVAKEQAALYPNVLIVHKRPLEGGGYALVWHNAAGGVLPLPPLKPPPVSAAGASSSNAPPSVLTEEEVVAYATHSIESLLETKTLLVNPVPGRLVEARTYFVLTGSGEDAVLSWCDPMGTLCRQELSPAAREWLGKHPVLGEKEQAIFKCFLLQLTPGAERVDAARKTLAGAVVAKSRGGIPLITVANMEKISRMQQQDGYHFLTRSIVNGVPGRWELYVRQEGEYRLLYKTHVGASTSKVTETSWDEFGARLAALHDCLPQKIPPESFARLRQAIPVGAQVLQMQGSACYVVADFSENTTHDFPPKTFIVGRENNLYGVTHDRMSTGGRVVVRLDWNECPEAQAVVAAWTHGGRITDAMLTQLKVALEGFEPVQFAPKKAAGRIDLNKLVAVASHFGHRAKMPEPAKLKADDTRFAVIKELMEKKYTTATAAPAVAIAATSAETSPAPVALPKKPSGPEVGRLDARQGEPDQAILKLFAKRAQALGYPAAQKSAAKPVPQTVREEDAQKPLVIG